MKSDLTEDQQKVHDGLLEFINTPSDFINQDTWVAVLKGWAGTGKTYTTSVLIQNLVEQGLRVAVTAPTGKAVKVLREMAKKFNGNVTALTTYSLLGLILKTQNDEQVIVQEGEPKIGEFDIVVVDEGSMVNLELDGFFIDACRSAHNLKAIFVGDPGQLPPIGEPDSIVFRKYNTQFELTEIVRQAEGNPIITLSAEVRKEIERVENGESPNEIRFETGKDASGHGVWVTSYKDLGNYFSMMYNEKWNPDKSRTVCWTNKKMDDYNHIAHDEVIGESEFHYQPGEVIVFRSPLVNSEGKVVVPVEDEAIITTITRDSHVDYGFPVYRVSLRTLEGDVAHDIVTYVPGEDQGLKDALKQIANKAKKAKGYERRKVWDQYWELKGSLIDIKHPYAITAHRSQGSTFQNVIIDYPDIMRNSMSPYRFNKYEEQYGHEAALKEKQRVDLERLKLLYVACTRASHNLVVVQ